MKRRTILLVILIAIMFVLTGCGKREPLNPVNSLVIDSAGFNTIDGKETLVYSIETRVVYYMFDRCVYGGYMGFGYSYFAPYISENGNFCRYIDGNIVEITD